LILVEGICDGHFHIDTIISSLVQSLFNSVTHPDTTITSFPKPHHPWPSFCSRDRMDMAVPWE